MAEKQWQLLNRQEIEEKWPLHCYIFEDKQAEFQDALLRNKVGIEEKDPCGRTALHLAVSLGKAEFVKELLQHGADANAVNKQGWNVCQEAVSCGIPDILLVVFQHRDCQRSSQRLDGIPELLEDLDAAPDFYVEMKWEFTTWVPFMSRMCPNDTYRIYKKGCNVRVDTTLVGFDQNRVNWERGNMSFIFKGAVEEGAEFMEIDHERKTFTKELLQMRAESRDVSRFELTEQAINTRMSSPNMSTILDTDSIAFTKHKTMWGWGGDKTEMVEKYEGKVYDATGIDVVTRIRLEHLTEEDKAKAKASSSGGGIQSILSSEEEETECFSEDPDIVDPDSLNPYNLSLEEYFNIPLNKSKKDIGRPKDTVTKTQKFKASLCLCPSYPLSLQQQVLPVIKLLAISNSHFAKLRDFVALHLPSGFPVKIEIPLFHFLNARITFVNINAIDTPVTGVQSQQSEIPKTDAVNDEEEPENEIQMTCSIAEECFDVPSNYVTQGVAEQQHTGSYGQNEEELLIQLAIQQSLAESAERKPVTESWAEQFPEQDEDDLQRAIRESLISSGQGGAAADNRNVTSYDEELQIALAMSEQEVMSKNSEDRSEDDELERILKLSLTEK